MSNLAISSEQADRLFWLGRYIERVYSTLKLFNNSVDIMIDGDGSHYLDLCRQLAIPSECYAGPDDFVASFLYSRDNADSVYSNLSRAYDNAIVLRNFISSESLSYIQMALDHLEKGGINQSAFLETQVIIDWLLGFWGSIEETVEDPHRRDLLKVGKYVERIDLGLRLGWDYERIMRIVPRLRNRTERVAALLNADVIGQLRELLSDRQAFESNKAAALALVNALHQ